MKIGLDLDNTIIDHSSAFGGRKDEVRDALRARGPDGERAWLELQRRVYGDGLARARLADGCAGFLRRCRLAGASVHIVSHKTPELRDAARAWLERRGFFDARAFGLRPDDVWLEGSRAEKVARIGALGCDVFVDDLPEVLADPGFPAAVRQVHYQGSWRDVEAQVFGAPAGGNSAVRRVEAGGDAHALKIYPPRTAADARDRLGVERLALELFARHGIRCVPRWLGADDAAARLEWIEGVPIIEPDAGDLDAALAFIADVKGLAAREPDGGASLPLASEACLSGVEILRQLDARRERLGARLSGVAPVRARVRAEALARATYRNAGLHFATPLAPYHRCLVPADLGFHNALRETGTGRVVFFDFEYFGWDDPVKLAADFLLHPGHRLSAELAQRFADGMRGLFAADETFATRLQALLPLYAVRWALILLKAGQPERAAALLAEHGP